jgi:hypothetical protein
MFQTSKDMQLRNYPDELSQGRAHWHSITQTLLIRWFQVRYVCADTAIEQILMTGDLDVLEAINTDTSFHLLGVNLVSPPSINGTDNWMMSPLRRVTTLVGNRLSMELLLSYEYHLDDGGMLVERLSSTMQLDAAGVERKDLFIRCNP